MIAFQYPYNAPHRFSHCQTVAKAIVTGKHFRESKGDRPHRLKRFSSRKIRCLHTTRIHDPNNKLILPVSDNKLCNGTACSDRKS